MTRPAGRHAGTPVYAAHEQQIDADGSDWQTAPRARGRRQEGRLRGEFTRTRAGTRHRRRPARVRRGATTTAAPSPTPTATTCSAPSLRRPTPTSCPTASRRHDFLLGDHDDAHGDVHGDRTVTARRPAGAPTPCRGPRRVAPPPTAPRPADRRRRAGRRRRRVGLARRGARLPLLPPGRLQRLGHRHGGRHRARQRRRLADRHDPAEGGRRRQPAGLHRRRPRTTRARRTCSRVPTRLHRHMSAAKRARPAALAGRRG